MVYSIQVIIPSILSIILAALVVYIMNDDSN